MGVLARACGARVCMCARGAQAWTVLPPHIAAAVGAMDDKSFTSDQHVPTTHEHYVKVGRAGRGLRSGAGAGVGVGAGRGRCVGALSECMRLRE